MESFLENESFSDEIGALLHSVAKSGNPEMVQYYLDSGSHVDATNEFGQTPLLVCLESDFPCKQVVELLLKYGADIFMEDSLAGNSAHKLVGSIEWLGKEMERFEILKMFLERGCYLDYSELLVTADEKVMEKLLQTNINLSTANSLMVTVVHRLAQNPNPRVIKLLRGKSFDINAGDTIGRTPLMYAVWAGISSSVEFLLDEGADIEATDENKYTALYMAYKNVLPEENKKCIQILLERGANAQVEVEGYTIFDLVLKYNLAVCRLTLSHLALQETNGIVITPLIRHKIDSNHQFKAFFEYSKQQLGIKIYRSFTLLDILTTSERKLERYLRDKELALALAAFKTADYFETIVRKRFLKAVSTIELRKTAASIICELMGINYDSYPSIAEGITDYLEEKDMENLISIHN